MAKFSCACQERAEKRPRKPEAPGPPVSTVPVRPSFRLPLPIPSLNIPIGGKKKDEKEKVRSAVIAHVELIESETGNQIFTTGLRGDFEANKEDLAYEMSDRELLARAADDLANSFIDSFLARREARFVGMYDNKALELDKGIDLVQLGDCAKAEVHFRNVYARYQAQLNDLDTAKIMYNHGISLMCSNRSAEAQARLWASLRLMNDTHTFEAIKFANDTIDRGRTIMAEDDSIIMDVMKKAEQQTREPSSEFTVGASAPGSPQQGRR